MIDAFVKSVETAFQNAKTLLWPIHQHVWLKLLFLYLLTGGCGSSTNIHIPTTPDLSKFQQKNSSSLHVQANMKAAPFDVAALKLKAKSWIEFARNYWNENKRLILTLAAIGATIIFLMMLIMMWLFSRLKLVLIKSLLQREIHIRQYWQETQIIGESFFYWNLFLSLFIFIPILGVAGGFIFSALKGIFVLKTHWPLLVAFGLGLFFYLFLASFFAWIFQNFLSILMVSSNEKPWHAAKRVGDINLKKLFKAIAILFFYILVVIGVGIGVGIASLILLIPVGLIVGGLMAMITYTLHLTSLIMGIALISLLVGVPLVILLGLVVVVPVQTFLNYLKIEIMKPFMGVASHP